MDVPRSDTFTENEPLRCAQCGEIVTLAAGESNPVCASCGSTELVPSALPDGTAGAPAVEGVRDEDRELPSWLADPAALLADPGEYLCFEDGEEVVVVPLTREWTRIGRGLAADVRFDDPTVSRRHALIVRGVDGVRVLDDRSLNGVFVNGQRVEWSPLTHGDEIRVGRHRLYYATLEPVGAAAPTTI
jgi:ribosomal protein S27AE